MDTRCGRLYMFSELFMVFGDVGRGGGIGNIMHFCEC